jgi:hypothetical protein
MRDWKSGMPNNLGAGPACTVGRRTQAGLDGEPLGVPMREQTLRGGQLRGLGNAFGLAETAKSRRVMDVFEIVSVQQLRRKLIVTSFSGIYCGGALLRS